MRDSTISGHRQKTYKTLVFTVIAILLVVIGFLIGYLVKDSHVSYRTGSGIEQVRVSRVIDGDTIDLVDGRRVRYTGIDTPETGDELSEQATARNRELVEGKVVELQPGNQNMDQYGRIVRYVFVDGTFVNAELVAEGLAKSYIFNPEDMYSQVLVQLEQYARLSRKGIWSGDPSSSQQAP